MDSLVKRLRDFSHESSPHDDSRIFHAIDLMDEAADALDQRWISVDERLPDFRKQEELIAWEDDVQMGAYYKGQWCYWSGKWKPCANQNVTHWRYLDGPESGERNG